jgi:hypothetical protein
MKRLSKILLVSVLILAACAPAATPTATTVPTLTALPTATLTLQPKLTVIPTNTATSSPTKKPFAELSICRNWKEAEKCPITKNDFKKISEFVKANFKFPDKAVTTHEVVLADSYWSTTLSFAIPYKDLEPNFVAKVQKLNYKDGINKLFYGTPLSFLGEPFYFYIPAKGDRIKNPVLVAVYPFNNADHTLGTYTIISPRLPDDAKWAPGDMIMRTQFEGTIYCPIAYSFNFDFNGYYSEEIQGTWVNEMFKDVNNPNGTRRQLLDNLIKTQIVSPKMEETPFFGAYNMEGFDFWKRNK